MPRKSDKHSVELLASSFVLGIGLLFCMMLVYALSPNPGVPLTICGAIFVGFYLFAWLLRDKSSGPGSLRLWLDSRKPAEPIEYTPRTRSPRSGVTSNNAPPTLKQVKDDKQTNLKTWVPASTKAKRNDNT